jgi:hypothetical protein
VRAGPDIVRTGNPVPREPQAGASDARVRPGPARLRGRLSLREWARGSNPCDDIPPPSSLRLPGLIESRIARRQIRQIAPNREARNKIRNRDKLWKYTSGVVETVVGLSKIDLAVDMGSNPEIIFFHICMYVYIYIIWIYQDGIVRANAAKNATGSSVRMHGLHYDICLTP